MDVMLWSPLLVAAGLLAAGSVAIMLLPDSQGPLDDTVEDISGEAGFLSAHKPLEDTVEDAEDSEVTLHCSSGGVNSCRLPSGAGGSGGGGNSSSGGDGRRGAGSSAHLQQQQDGQGDTHHVVMAAAGEREVTPLLQPRGPH
jgi:hypothetical protein